MFAPLFKKLL